MWTARLFPFPGPLHNGLLVVRGDFEGNETIKNFIQNKFGTSVKDGISEIIDRIHEQGGNSPKASTLMSSARRWMNSRIWK